MLVGVSLVVKIFAKIYEKIRKLDDLETILDSIKDATEVEAGLSTLSVDKLWTPSDGWSAVWEMLNLGNVLDFANWSSYNKNLSVDEDNGWLVFNPPSGDTGEAWHRRYTQYSRIAFRMKIDLQASGSMIRTIASFEIRDGSNRCSVRISNYAGETGVIVLEDYLAAVTKTFSIPSNGWITVVYDWTESIAKVYDDEKNLIAMLEITKPSYTASAESMMSFIERNNVDELTYKLYVDWVAVKW